METKKYKLTDEILNYQGRTLYRIEALKDFRNVKVGDKGGWIEKEENLSQEGNCWVADDAKVWGRAKVNGAAQIYGDAEICRNAWIGGYAQIYGDAWVFGNACVYEHAQFGDDEKIGGSQWVK